MCIHKKETERWSCTSPSREEVSIKIYIYWQVPRLLKDLSILVNDFVSRTHFGLARDTGAAQLLIDKTAVLGAKLLYEPVCPTVCPVTRAVIKSRTHLGRHSEVYTFFCKL